MNDKTNTQHHQLFAFNTLIAAALKEIKRVQGFIVQTERYELIAQLRDIEMRCQGIEADIDCGIFPTLADKVIETGNPNYFNLLFIYGYLQKWKDLSRNFDSALALRKSLLNEDFVLGDVQKKKFNSLNNMMSSLEAKSTRFYYDLKKMAGDNLFVDDENRFIVLKCYAKNMAYNYLNMDPDRKKPFYEFGITHSQWIGSLDAPGENEPGNCKQVEEYQIFTRAIEFDDDTSFFFSVFALEGYLAWEDFMNIEDIEVEMRLGCSFTAK